MRVWLRKSDAQLGLWEGGWFWIPDDFDDEWHWGFYVRAKDFIDLGEL